VNGTPVDDPAEVAATLQLVMGRIVRKLRQGKSDIGGVTLSEGSVLARLDRDGPDSPTSLATLEGVRPQAMAATLAALEERGLVSRTPDPADGRRAVLAVTEAGHQVVVDRRSVSLRRLTGTLEREFSPDERVTLHTVLPLLERLAERM
jgi:DNA-binding MarR family transcriptional regulator